MNDPVNKPSHYNQAGIEVIEVIETYTPNSPHLANVLKYVCRHSYKGKPLEDLKKAQWYLNRAINIMEHEQNATPPLETGAPVYVQPSLERVPGSNGPVHRDYYGYNPDDVEGHCDECGDAICSRDAKISADHVTGRVFCSIACLAEHKFWDDFKGPGGTE